MASDNLVVAFDNQKAGPLNPSWDGAGGRAWEAAHGRLVSCLRLARWFGWIQQHGAQVLTSLKIDPENPFAFPKHAQLSYKNRNDIKTATM